MNFKVLKSTYGVCTCCMKEHDIKDVLVPEHFTFKDKGVDFKAEYTYCDIADEMYETEEQIQKNDISMKDAYRKAEGLLTSSEIEGIRCKYGISQSDFCTVLGWGKKTITRYETHQVQDKAHDAILKKMDNDPEWFITLLKDAKNSLPVSSYKRCMDYAIKIIEAEQDRYLRKSIEACYAGVGDNKVKNMCKVLDRAEKKGERKGIKEGMLSTLSNLVKKGMISLETAAQEANMSIVQFKKQTGIGMND